MDQSGLYCIEDVLVDLRNSDIDVLLVGLAEQPKYMLERIDIIPDLISKDKIYADFETCLTYIKENVEDIYPPA